MLCAMIGRTRRDLASAHDGYRIAMPKKAGLAKENGDTHSRLTGNVGVPTAQ